MFIFLSSLFGTPNRFFKDDNRFLIKNGNTKFTGINNRNTKIKSTSFNIPNRFFGDNNRFVLKNGNSKISKSNSKKNNDILDFRYQQMILESYKMYKNGNNKSNKKYVEDHKTVNNEIKNVNINKVKDKKKLEIIPYIQRSIKKHEINPKLQSIHGEFKYNTFNKKYNNMNYNFGFSGQMGNRCSNCELNQYRRYRN